MNNKILSLEKKIWVWLMVSSSDPAKASFMVKGIFVLIIPKALALLPFIGIHLSPDIANLPDAIYAVVFYGLNIVGSIMAFAGAMRKVYYLFVPKPINSGY